MTWVIINLGFPEADSKTKTQMYVVHLQGVGKTGKGVEQWEEKGKQTIKCALSSQLP